MMQIPSYPPLILSSPAQRHLRNVLGYRWLVQDIISGCTMTRALSRFLLDQGFNNSRVMRAGVSGIEYLGNLELSERDSESVNVEATNPQFLAMST
jgi:hypothetical protein